MNIHSSRKKKILIITLHRKERSPGQRFRFEGFTQSNSEITFIDSPKKRYDYEVGRRYGCSDKLYNFTGYKPNTSLEVGLRATLEYSQEAQLVG